jgi:hypothetical protein
MEGALHNILSTDAGVIALVTDRVYQVVLPQETALPAVLITRISTTGRELTQDGTLGVAEAVMEIASYATTINEAQALSRACRLAVRDRKGAFSGVQVLRVQFINEANEFSLTANMFAQFLDVAFLYRET